MLSRVILDLLFRGAKCVILCNAVFVVQRSRACNLKDRTDLPSVINKKLTTPSTEAGPPVFDNGVDTSR